MFSQIKVIYTIVLIVLFLPMSAFASVYLPETLRAEPHQRDDYDWLARHEAVLARHRIIQPDVLFIGDSITHHWGGEPIGKRRVSPDVWDALFAGMTVSNLGFGFDYVDNAYWRVENGELDGIMPRLIILNIGTNNIGHRGDSPQQCVAHLKALVHQLQVRLPQTEILVLGIYPRREPHLREPITLVNRLLADCMVGERLRFADVGHCLSGADGLANPIYFRDTVHPNAKGYARLAEALRPLIMVEKGN